MDRSDYVIRKAMETDLPAIEALIRSVRIHPGRLDWRCFWVAVSPVDGVVSCAQIRAGPGGISEIASVAALKAWQGRGVAVALGRRMVAEHGGPLLGACMRRMVPFYEKFGAKEIVNASHIPFRMRWRKRFVNMFLFVAGRKGRLVVMGLKGEQSHS